MLASPRRKGSVTLFSRRVTPKPLLFIKNPVIRFPRNQLNTRKPRPINKLNLDVHDIVQLYCFLPQGRVPWCEHSRCPLGKLSIITINIVNQNSNILCWSSVCHGVIGRIRHWSHCSRTSSKNDSFIFLIIPLLKHNI